MPVPFAPHFLSRSRFHVHRSRFCPAHFIIRAKFGSQKPKAFGNPNFKAFMMPESWCAFTPFRRPEPGKNPRKLLICNSSLWWFGRVSKILTRSVYFQDGAPPAQSVCLCPKGRLHLDPSLSRTHHAAGTGLNYPQFSFKNPTRPWVHGLVRTKRP